MLFFLEADFDHIVKPWIRLIAERPITEILALTPEQRERRRIRKAHDIHAVHNKNGVGIGGDEMFDLAALFLGTMAFQRIDKATCHKPRCRFRFAEEFLCAFANGLAAQDVVSDAGKHDDRHGAADAAQTAQCFKAAAIGQIEIEDHRIHRCFFELGDGVRQPRHKRDLEIAIGQVFQMFAREIGVARIILDEQKLECLLFRLCVHDGNLMRLSPPRV